MIKVNRTTGRRSRVFPKGGFGRLRETARRERPRWLLLAVAALLGWTVFAVRNGAEEIDSGWAVAIPSPLASGSAPANLEQQLILRHVLEQSQQPLLRKPAPGHAAQSKPEHAHADGVRFAVRPEGVDVWRPVGQSSASSGDDLTTRIGTLQRRAAGVVNAKAVPNPTPAPFPAAPASKLSEPAPASEIQEDPAVDTEAEEAFSDATFEPTPADSTAPKPATEADGQLTDDTADSSPEPAIAAPQQKAPVVSSSPTATAPSTDVTPVKESPPLTKQLIYLRNRIRAVLKGYYRKPLMSRENDPWEVMHGMLAYGVYSRVHDGGPNGELITSVGWLCYNKPCKGQTMLYVTPAGELRAKYGVGLQGHLGQFLAMLAQCHVSPDYPIRVGGHEFTIHDLIEAEKKTCYPKSELTFKLIALQHYADLNDKWVNDQGLDWDFPRLLREELAQPIRGAACGGTHRLSGLSLTVKTRLRRGEPLDGEYQRAAEFVKRYQQYAFRLQNRDGSLSTSWFRGSGDEDDINRRIKTTGHILEWLCYSLSDEELREQRTIRAVTYLANLMYSNYDNDWEIGPRSHATHALLLYDERVFQPFDKAGEVAVYRPARTLARRVQSTTLRR